MRTKDLLNRIGKGAPCLACEPTLGKMQQEGLSDFVYSIRKLADQLWEEKNIEEEVRFAINNELAELVRRMSGEEERKDMRDLLERIEDLISSTPSLAKCWSEVSVLAIEPLNR